MRKSFTAIVLVALFAITSAGVRQAVAQPSSAALRGHALDHSGARLPGVTVIATAVTSGRVVGVTTTDGEGAYRFAGVPAGPVDLSFELNGFSNRQMRVIAQPGVDADVIGQLEIASLSEAVLVRGEEPPPPPKVMRATVIPVVSHDRDAVCGPAKAGVIPTAIGTLLASDDVAVKQLFVPGDRIAIKGGTETGLDVGRNIVVRRYFEVDGSRGPQKIMGEHSSGLLQVVAANVNDSVAVVVYTCDEMMAGDFVAPFEPLPVRRPEPPGEPMFDRAAKILFADDRQMVGVPRRMLVIDRGADHGVFPGERMTIFKRAKPDARPTVVGEAIVVAVRDDSATIRVESASDPIYFGDFAAPQQPASGAAAVPASQGASR